METNPSSVAMSDPLGFSLLMHKSVQGLKSIPGSIRMENPSSVCQMSAAVYHGRLFLLSKLPRLDHS
jgi:hypothetical protein